MRLEATIFFFTQWQLCSKQIAATRYTKFEQPHYSICATLLSQQFRHGQSDICQLRLTSLLPETLRTHSFPTVSEREKI